MTDADGNTIGETEGLVATVRPTGAGEAESAHHSVQGDIVSINGVSTFRIQIRTDYVRDHAIDGAGSGDCWANGPLARRILRAGATRAGRRKRRAPASATGWRPYAPAAISRC